MKRFVVLIGDIVHFTRIDEADTLRGIKAKATKERNGGCCTRLVDTTIVMTDCDDQLHYQELNDDGTIKENVWHSAAWIKAKLLE